jgi:diguanylate cyclase (GGDEF)-like protein/PAS domain S-box-containing protein
MPLAMATSEEAAPGPAAGQPTAFESTGAKEALASWLNTHASALVASLDASGAPVEMPSSIPLGSGHRHDPSSVFELVLPEDSRAVADAFVAAVARGIGAAKVHLSADPDRSQTIQYLDLRREHGVILRIMFAGFDATDEPAPALPLDPVPHRPRLCSMTKSEVATILTVDRASTQMLGWESEELVGHSTLDFIHPEDHVRAIANWTSRLTADREHSVQTVRLRYRCKDGKWLWLETSNDFQQQQDGSTVVVTQLIDVSEEMAAVEALRHSEQFLRQVTDTVPVGLFHVAGDGTVAFVNPVLCDLLGDALLTTREQLVTAMTSDSAVLDSAIGRVLESGHDFDLELPLCADGERSARVTLRAVVDLNQVVGVLGCVVDVTELRTLADTDWLTGLLNRRSIVELLESEVERSSGGVSVIFADLDGFKHINDEFGHQVGDQLLAAVADRLRSALRPGDRIGRLGGDEFLIFCPGLVEPRAASAVARRLEIALEDEFRLPELTVRVVASLGVACGHPGATADELISISDTAMYESKQGRALARNLTR